jgi:formamidopyrimidine-DNA glycosylase
MPELPDVETFRRRLARSGLHREIGRVEVRDPTMLHGVRRDGLRQALRGHELTTTRRHGKHLFAKADGSWLGEHFGMTGYLLRADADDAHPEHTRFVLHFKDRRSLALVDQRPLGSVRLVDDPDRFVADEQLGPDALAVTEAELRRLLAEHRGGLKAALMDQRLVVGIGNIYSDEILFQARLHPKLPASDLDESAHRRLHRQVGRVLRTAIDRQADPGRLPRSWLLRHREDGAACPRGNGQVRRLRSHGRGAFCCPACQPSPRSFAHAVAGTHPELR